MPKISVEMELVDVEEIESTLRTLISKIDWVLENNPPRRAGQAEALDTRAKHLTLIAAIFVQALNNRALNEANTKV
jgi:hypothetical protein